MKIINKIELLELIRKKKLEGYKDEILEELSEVTSKALEKKIKEIKNKNRIIKNDLTKEHLSAKKTLTKEQISSLPKWVIDDIDNAQIIGKSKQVIKTSDGKKYHIKNPLNDLPGGKWTFFLNSVINTRYPSAGDESYAHHIRKVHPSPKPPQLMKEIIEFFSKENEIVFDYFSGVGGTLIGSSLCNRRAIGIDLSSEYIKVYKEANKFLRLKEQKTIIADSIEFLNNSKNLKKHLKEEKISLILIDPPYGDMMSRPKTGEAIKKKQSQSPTPFTNSKKDLGNMDWISFLKIFNKSIIDSMKFLKHKGHIVVFIKDLQPNAKELNLLHADIIRDLNKIDNLNYLGTKIWADQGVNLYPYGYPYAYVSNQIHQYIMTFKKV